MKRAQAYRAKTTSRSGWWFKRITDKRLLKLIRAFLNAGMVEGGLVGPTEEGTPQGVPLSPPLSNLVLDEDLAAQHRRQPT